MNDEVRIRFKWEVKDLDRMRKLPLYTFERALKYIAACVWGEMGKEAPTAPEGGRLAGSFDLKKMAKFAWGIYSGVRYAIFVHEGTGMYGPVGQPYFIAPRTKQVLHWKIGGQKFFSKGHWMFGQKPNPYADRAMETTQKRMKEFISRAIHETKWLD